MSYHNGSIWPHDNALIARGFARYGLNASAEKIFDALMRATAYMDHRRIPELYCGFAGAAGADRRSIRPRARRRLGPRVRRSPCCKSMLGMTFDAGKREIRLVNPVLPAATSEITLRNLTLNEAAADIVLRNSGGRVTLDVLRAKGDIGVRLVTRL